MHAAHGDIHEIGLQDECGDCFDHADEPWNTLDQEMLSKLIRRNYDWRFNKTLTGIAREAYKPRSHAEAIAMANITTLMERMGALMSADNDGVILSYFEKYWRIEL